MKNITAAFAAVEVFIVEKRSTETELSNQRGLRRSEYAQERFPLLPVERCFLEILLDAPLPDYVRECAAIDRTRASNLEVLSRGLAAIGNFFVFDRLSFVE